MTFTVPETKRTTGDQGGRKEPEQPKEKGAFVVRDDDDDENTAPSGQSESATASSLQAPQPGSVERTISGRLAKRSLL